MELFGCCRPKCYNIHQNMLALFLLLEPMFRRMIANNAYRRKRFMGPSINANTMKGHLKRFSQNQQQTLTHFICIFHILRNDRQTIESNSIISKKKKMSLLFATTDVWSSQNCDYIVFAVA